MTLPRGDATAAHEVATMRRNSHACRRFKRCRGPVAEALGWEGIATRVAPMIALLSLSAIMGACPLQVATDDIALASDASATQPDAQASRDAGPTPPDGETTDDLQTPPLDLQALDDWLAAKRYAAWIAETEVHPSLGPHFGQVRTFFNDALARSVRGTTHPEGAAAVKELYGAGTTVQGYSVMVKLQPESAGGDGWFFYETYQGATFANSVGSATCTGCHASGVDFIRSPIP